MGKVVENPLIITQGIPGLSVKASETGDADITVIYDPDTIPTCQADDDTMAEPNGYTKKRIVYDRVAGKIARVCYKQRRYKCPLCGKEMEYESPYIRQGSKTTNRMARWIANEALYHSLDDVSAQTSGLISKAQVGRILKTWAEQETMEYLIHLEEPSQLGIHIVGSPKEWYLLLSDLENELFLDIVPLSAAASTVTALLMRLMYQNQAKLVCTELDSTCFVPAIAVYKSTPVMVAPSSIYRIYAMFTHEVVSAQYKGAKKRLLLQLISTPLSEKLTPDELDKIQLLGSRSGYEVNAVIEELVMLRKLILERQLGSQMFHIWISRIDWIKATKDLVRHFKFADEEITLGLSKENTSAAFDNNSKLANQIIGLNQQCSYDLLRARMLLTVAPELVQVQSGRVDYYYTGISMSKLYDSMRKRLPDNA